MPSQISPRVELVPNLTELNVTFATNADEEVLVQIGCIHRLQDVLLGFTTVPRVTSLIQYQAPTEDIRAHSQQISKFAMSYEDDEDQADFCPQSKEFMPRWFDAINSNGSKELCA
ncbi:hypothetical protein BGZ59_005893 [Podila verticillata]|nr:hypothetical protein BGZ59_005893 [Podila verticillata]